MSEVKEKQELLKETIDVLGCNFDYEEEEILKEIIKDLDELQKYRELGSLKEFETAKQTVENYASILKNDIRDLAEQINDRDCSKCRNKGTCAIYDNFNIHYCSDWEKKHE